MALPLLPFIYNGRVFQEFSEILNFSLKFGHFYLLDDLKFTVLDEVDVFVQVSLVKNDHVLDAGLGNQISTEIDKLGTAGRRKSPELGYRPDERQLLVKDLTFGRTKQVIKVEL